MSSDGDVETAQPLLDVQEDGIPTLPEGVSATALSPEHLKLFGVDGCIHDHKSTRSAWLRALVLGANDGLVSVSALLMGVGAGSSSLDALRLSGMAGLVGGALSMAVGEYISVSSQRDSEVADIEVERQEQEKGPLAQARELHELTLIYVGRGLDYDLAHQVAVALTKKDVVRAHARDELGIDLDDLAQPVQAAVVSAICFTSGGAIPLLSAFFITDQHIRLVSILLGTTAGLLFFGFIGAHLGGARPVVGSLRVVLGGWLALAAVFLVGKLAGSEGI